MMKIGDLVEEVDPERPEEKFPMGIVIPFPAGFPESVGRSAADYENGDIVWVSWPQLGQENWCYIDELRLLNENR